MKAMHINITIPVDLKARLDAEAERAHVARSTLIQRAVALYLDLAKGKQMRKLLAEGYAEMAGEALKVTEEFETLDAEAMKHVD